MCKGGGVHVQKVDMVGKHGGGGMHGAKVVTWHGGGSRGVCKHGHGHGHACIWRVHMDIPLHGVYGIGLIHDIGSYSWVQMVGTAHAKLIIYIGLGYVLSIGNVDT